jgi:chromatin structure-remodeling complex subunit RSC9
MHRMRLAFEAYPDGEVTQVALWTAYRTEFEPHSISSPMLAAADVIKMSTEAFPAALPMVTDGPDKRFIIKGIRIRDRTGQSATLRAHERNRADLS